MTLFEFIKFVRIFFQGKQKEGQSFYLMILGGVSLTSVRLLFDDY